MGLLGDRIKELRDQAQRAVADNKDKIHGAVDSAGGVANSTTKGKFADKIAKLGEKVHAGVEKFGAGADADAESAPVVEEPLNPVTASDADEARAGFPEFDKPVEPPPDFDGEAPGEKDKDETE